MLRWKGAERVRAAERAAPTVGKHERNAVHFSQRGFLRKLAKRFGAEDVHINGYTGKILGWWDGEITLTKGRIIFLIS